MSVVCVNVNVHKGELSSMRTGDTASYLLHDFFFSLVCFASASYCMLLAFFYLLLLRVFFFSCVCCVFLCVEIIIYNFI